MACGESSQDKLPDACKDVLCERGVCSDGECVNPANCEASGDCLEDNYCSDDGVCVQDLCEDVNCERGECQPSTGQCVNAGVCTIETQATDCIDGHLCYDNRCVTEAEICAELACETGRGVCNPSQRKCENADNCQGDDGLCLSGHFCNDQNECQVNVCNNTTLTCERGVCNPDTGQCINPDTCDGQADCLDDHYCIAQSCTEPAQACSDCSGNQRCDYDDAAQSVTCHENDNGCRYSLDCLGERVCRNNTCVEPVACEADAYEANDSFETATDLRGLLAEGRINASICEQDEDYYFFDVRGSGLSRGELIVDLRFNAEDIGIGTLHVEVFDHTHQKVAEGASDDRGHLTLQKALTPAQINQYFIKVRGAESLHSSGIRYTVFADFISTNVIEACLEAIELQPGITLSNSRQGKSYELGSSCTASNNLAVEDVYRIELERRSFVTLTATPKPVAGQLVDISLSLRESCLTQLSEAACVNAGGNDAVERIRQPLEPGEYFVIVQGPQANTGGPYQLEFQHEPVICSPGQGECTAEGSSKVCNAMGTGFDTIHCDQGCDDTLGYCVRTPGDVCYAAIDASNGYTGEIVWSHFANEYEPASGSCVDSADANGPEVAYRVDIQPGHAMQVNLVTSTDYATLYLVDDCENLGTSCLATSAETISLPNSRKQKTLFHTNNTNEVQRLFVIADTNAEKLVGKAQISIAVGQPSCTPGQFQCGPEGLEECNQTGVGYELLRPCPFGCDSENFRCNPVQNNQCKGAVDIMAHGGTFTNRIQDYTNNYNLGFSSCVGASTPGSDAVFMVEAQQGEVISASVAADFNVALYMMTNCNEPLGSCKAASYHVQATREAVQYVAPEDGRYYIVVDSPTTAPVGWFTLNVSVETPMCPPGNLLGCVDDRTLSYCGDLGAPSLYACETGCTGNQCDTQTGGVCHDAVVLRSGDQAVGNFAGTNSLNPGEGAVGSCYFDSEPIGVNTFYAVELQAGDVLVASAYVPTPYYGDPYTPTETMMIYLMDDCTQASSCLMNSSNLARPDLTYIADVDKTVYIVVSRDKASSSSSITYSLDVNIIKPECVPGTRTCRDATTLEFCSALGLPDTMDCNGGCENDACAVPGGDSCPDAIALPATAHVSGVFNDHTEALNPGRGIKGQCDFGNYEANGRDAIYAVEMQEGQHLQVDVLTAGTSTWAYVLEDCNNTNSCVANAPDYLGGYKYAINYVAKRTGTHYIVVDSSQTTSSTVRPYEMFVNVSDPGCTPGTITCLDPQTLSVCQPDGSLLAQPCTDGCSNDRCNSPNGQMCGDAIPAKSGERYAGSFLGLDTLNPGSGQVGSCDFGSREAPGRDTIYAVELKAGEQLFARLDSEALQTIMYLLEDCSSENTCLANTASGRQLELTYTADTDKTVYVVVDRTDNYYAVAQYALDIFVTSSACQPGTTQCLADGRTLSICDDSGNWHPYVCEGGCTDASCDTPRGDVCQDAIALTHGSTVTGDWTGSNHINPGRDEVGQCSFGTREGNGRDTIYAVTVPAGKVLSATLQTAHSSAMLYLLEDCNDASSCLLNNPTLGSSSFFYPPATYERTMYIVVDRNSGANNDYETTTYELSVSFEDPECFPGDSICGADPDQIRMCNHLGVWEDYTCSSTCSAGQCDNPNADSCAEAVVLQPGESVTSNWTGTNTLNPGTGVVGTCDFGTANMQGRERIYAISLDQGDVLTAKLDTTLSTARLYLLTDCLDASSCLDNTRRSGAGVLRYVAEDTGTVFVVVDGTASTSQSTNFTLTVDVEYPHCTKGERQCAPDGKTVQECNSFGIFDSYECDGTCTDGACDVPKGDHCFDAIPMVAGVEYSGDWQGTNSMHFGPGAFGQCSFSGTTHSQGRDTIFSVELEQGEQLRLDYTTQASASSVQMYLMEDCELADSCLANMGMTSTSGSTTSMYYTADRTKTIFVVLDRTSTTTSATWTLVADIQQPCTIGATYCSDDNTLQICEQDQMFKPYACQGGCIDGRCELPTGDACRDALPVYSGDVIDGGWTMTNTINFGSGTAGQCAFTSAQTGRETVYAVDMVAGETLTANLETTQSSAVMYITEDCAYADKCVAFEKNGASTLYYTAEQNRTVFIVVDRSTTTSTANAYKLHVDVQPPSCLPGETATCLDDDTLQVCTYMGIYEAIPCQDGCTDGACNTAGGDTCYDAIPLVPGQPFTANYNAFTARTNPGTDTCMYASQNNQRGIDAVFAIELEAGQMLQAELETSPSAAGMYVLDSCEVNPAKACVAAAPRSKSLQFLATSSQTYYLVVDRADTGTTGNFTLRTSIEDTFMVCQPNSSTCDPNTGMLQICSDDGSHYKTTVHCEHGCARDFCATAPAVGGVVHDTCDTAQLITQSTRIFEHYGRFTNDYNPGSSSCVGASTTGEDAVYRVYIPAREVLLVSVTTGYASRTPAIYVVEDCDDIANSCLGASSVSPTSTVGLPPQDTARFVYVIVDARSTSSTPEPFIVDFEFRPSECTPGQQVCSGANELSRCLDHHLYEQVDCPFGCAGTACIPPPNNTCEGAIDATQGLTITTDHNQYTNTYDPYDPDSGTSCTDYQTPGADTSAPGNDAIFFVDAERNETIYARMGPTDGFNAALWITTDCDNAAKACVAGSDALAIGSHEIIEYIVEEPGRYYIIADSRFAPNSGVRNFTLEIAVLPPFCEANTASCSDENTLSYCLPNGTAIVDYTCEGGCANSACQTPRGDICLDALPIVQSGSFTGNFAHHTNHLDPGFGSCTGFDAPGPDTIYSVTLSAGQTLDVTLANTNASSDLSLYLVTDCSAPRNTCLAGSDQYGGVPEQISYTASSDETIYIVADSWAPDTDTEYSLTVQIY